MVNEREQHCPEDATQRLGPPHSDMAMMVSPAVPATPTRPKGASRRGRTGAAAGLTRAVVASRAKPPERR